MKKYIIIILVFALGFQIGCEPIMRNQISVDEPEEILVEVSSEDRAIIDRSESLSDYVVELFGIDDTATIILNDTALVSVIMAYDKKLTSDVREMITETVINTDAGIKEVLISDDEKMFFKTVDIIGSLMSGTPYDKHVGEIGKMMEKMNRRN
ncbi:MAG: YhcN/YlaJ family sporulation lipoprotein [Tissierellaceae bacterium]